MKNKLSVGVALLALIMGSQVYAHTAACPSKATIEQEAMPGGGYSYWAPGPEGQNWVGEDPRADEVNLSKSVFERALYFKVSSVGNKDVVTCDYGEPVPGSLVGFRLSLKSFNGWAAAPNTTWNIFGENSQCLHGIETTCAFEYTSLTPPI